MKTLKIKYPTLITSTLESHHSQCIQMRNDVIGIINNYNNYHHSDKLRIPYRGKSKSKVLKAIHYTLCDIGAKQSLIICVEEYKEGYDDLYFQKAHADDINDITPQDRLGSSKNYALLYPIIDHRNGIWENKWLVVIYDTPNKDDTDIINTIKYTVNKILHFPFKFVVPTAFNGIPNIPRIEVSYVSIENMDNDHIVLKDHVVSHSAKTTKTIKYSDVPIDDVPTIINDKSNFISGMRKRIKIFTDNENKSVYRTISQEMDDDGNISSTFIAKYGTAQDISIEDIKSITDSKAMINNFSNVITNYLANGNI